VFDRKIKFIYSINTQQDAFLNDFGVLSCQKGSEALLCTDAVVFLITIIKFFSTFWYLRHITAKNFTHIKLEDK
jgi:hypothetical protein